MKFRCMAALVVVVGGSTLLAGCPLGFDLGSLGLGLGSGSYGTIPNGRYDGSVDAVVEFWENDELSSEESEEGYTDATFQNGVLLKDSGGPFRIGDVDFLEDGVYEIRREVYEIDYGAWGYEIAFDLTAEWEGVPATGWEIATYWLNADGTLDLYDEIELTTENWDGETRTVHSEAYATLARTAPAGPSPEPAPVQPQPRNLLDLKSGKIRR